MKSNSLSAQDRMILLKIAREAIDAAVNRRRLPVLDMDRFSENLQAIGSAFVTLTENGKLRGCIGGLEASQPLVQDVQEHAAAAAVEDYRFPPVEPNEISRLHVEISRLSAPQRLEYQSPMELPNLLRPNIDGVIISDGRRRATFLPQVWENLPLCDEFLSHLCQKMGAAEHLWQTKNLDIWTYQVEAFEEE
ncbi:MAG: AmmeMemoRadiSam system protein A [Anaerolineaceae bacterium]